MMMLPRRTWEFSDTNIIMVGNTGVGKSTLFKKLLDMNLVKYIQERGDYKGYEIFQDVFEVKYHDISNDSRFINDVIPYVQNIVRNATASKTPIVLAICYNFKTCGDVNPQSTILFWCHKFVLNPTEILHLGLACIQLDIENHDKIESSKYKEFYDNPDFHIIPCIKAHNLKFKFTLSYILRENNDIHPWMHKFIQDIHTPSSETYETTTPYSSSSSDEIHLNAVDSRYIKSSIKNMYTYLNSKPYVSPVDIQFVLGLLHYLDAKFNEK